MSYQEYLEEKQKEEYHNSPYPHNNTKNEENNTASASASASTSASAPTIEYTVLGKGGFGMVIKPALPNVKNGVSVEYPDNVTKIFLAENGYRKILEHSKEKLNEYMGPNNDHRLNKYTKEYRGRNISRNLREQLHISNSNIVWPVRMPYLGVDFSKLIGIYKKLREVPIVSIIQQFVKLMTQVNTLWEHNMVHGDIRPFNIMIHPTTGHMALIDFDWLKSIDDFYSEYRPNFGFYNNPPEFLITRLNDLKESLRKVYAESKKPGYREIYEPQKSSILNDYINAQYASFEALQTIYPDHTLGTAIMTAMNESIEASNYYLFLDPSKAEIPTVLKTFDSYGLANTLLVLIYYLYPGLTIPTKMDKEAFHLNLSSRFSGYTPAHLRASGDAIYNITYDVLYPMSDLRVKTRMTIDEGLAKTKAILATLEAALTASPTTGGRRTQKRKYRLRKSKKAKQTRRK